MINDTSRPKIVKQKLNKDQTSKQKINALAIFANTMTSHKSTHTYTAKKEYLSDH